MLRGLTCLAMLVASPVAAKPVVGEVTYVHAERVFVDLGRADGVEAGTNVQVLHRGKVVARLEVLEAGDHTCVARVLETKREIRPSMRARAVGIKAQPRKTPPVRPATAKAADWQPPTYARVEYRAAPTVRALSRVRSSAHLRGAAWIYLETDDTQISQRDSLRIAVAGPMDKAGRFWVDADVDVTGEPLAPDDARFRTDDVVWVDIYRAEVSYRNGGLAVGLGRAAPGRLRYGLLDGASLSYAFEDGPRVGVAAGLRPDAVTLYPGLDKPTAIAEIAGDAATSWGLLSYAWSASWLGGEGGTEGAESMAQLGLGIGSDWWLHADAGVFLLTPAGETPYLVVDRAAVSASFHFLDQWVARVAARRWQDPNLPSERDELPSTYLTQGGTYDAVASVDGTLARWSWLALQGQMITGGGFGEEDHHWRYWAAPSVTATASQWWRLRLRLGYRLELGWVGGQHVEGMLGIEPMNGLRIDVLQHGGVVVLSDTGEALPTYSTWLRMSAPLLDWLRLGVRARGIYGDAGRGVEASIWLAVHDLL